MNLVRLFTQILNVTLAPLEHYISQKIGELGINKYPPIFIIGAPRSGTTLLYKVLTEKFNLAYISNAVDYFYAIPIISNWLLKKVSNLPYYNEYDFEYGSIPGLASPSEFAEFWYQWFPKGKNIYVEPLQTPLNYLKQLRQSIGGISYIYKRPVIFKNVFNSMRIAPICEAMPNACFIVCKRDPKEIALSILNARKQNMQNHHQWWSLPPKEIDTLLKLDFAGQIAGQIYYTYNQINLDTDIYGRDRFLEIEYENFCQNVPAIIEKIRYFFKMNQIIIDDKKDVPKNFVVRKSKDINNEEQKRIFSAIDSYYMPNIKINEQQRKI